MEFEAKTIVELMNPFIEQLYCGMGSCIWRFNWSKPVKLFFIGKNFVKPSGETYYVTVSVAPIELDLRDESVLLLKKGFFRKRIVINTQENGRLAVLTGNWGSDMYETIIKSPYEKINLRISSFKHEPINIDYTKAVIITGYTKPAVIYRPIAFFKKILDTNFLIAEALIKSLYR